MFDQLEDALPGLEIDFSNQFGVTRRSGLLHSTRVATSMGWRAVEALAIGDEVLTFDNGGQKIVDIERIINWPDHKTCPDHAAPLEVPAGVLGNRERIWMLPNQVVMVESDIAEAQTGDPFALVPVSTLEGWRGVKRVSPRAPHLVIVLHFERDELIYVGQGMLAFTPAQRSILDHAFGASMYEPLDQSEAKSVVDGLRAADAAIRAA